MFVATSRQTNPYADLICRPMKIELTSTLCWNLAEYNRAIYKILYGIIHLLTYILLGCQCQRKTIDAEIWSWRLWLYIRAAIVCRPWNCFWQVLLLACSVYQSMMNFLQIQIDLSPHNSQLISGRSHEVLGKFKSEMSLHFRSVFKVIS